MTTRKFPDFLQLTRKNHLLFKRIPITTQKARSLDSEGNTLFTRAITLPLFSKLVTFVAIKNETHNKGWKVESHDKKFHRFLIRPSKQIYYIGPYAFATTLLDKKNQESTPTEIEPIDTWGSTWKRNVNVCDISSDDIKRFNESFQILASSSNMGILTISKDEMNFLDSLNDGHTEDISLCSKWNNADQSYKAISEAHFFNVSNHEHLILQLLLLAKNNDFIVSKMIDSLKSNPKIYQCEDIVFPTQSEQNLS